MSVSEADEQQIPLEPEHPGSAVCPTCGFEAVVCPACSAHMSPVFRFCGRCGADLRNACPRCGGGVALGLEFCGHCGIPLAESIRPEHGPEPDLPPLSLPDFIDLPEPVSEAQLVTPRVPFADEQLRRVAILFVDLVGSTALAEKLDPEPAYRIVSECVSGLGDVVSEAGGFVVKTLGDGLMALFGAPVAHGDDPERAGFAALKMQAWLKDHAAQVEREHGIALSARIGLNFGSVVAAPISAGGRPDYDVLGDAVNTAQRVESAAEPGTVYTTEAFYRVARGAFDFRSAGVAKVKGKAEPLALYQLVQPKAAEARAARGFPLVGREKVQSTLHHAARELAEGRGGYIFLTGAGGLGKTRLLEELADELTALGIRTLQGNAADAERAGPLSLWRGWLADLLAVHPGMPFPDAAAAVRSLLEDPEHQPWADWLAALVVEPQRLAALDPDSRDRTVRGALNVFLQHWQQGAPAALLVDEVDSLDGFTLSLITQAWEREERGALLVALTGRVSPSQLPAGAQVISLRPLSALASRKLVQTALPDQELDPDTITRLVERAGGSPLFLTMMLQAAREAPDPETVLSAVPDSLYGLIQAQIDRLSREERKLAQSCAVLGRGFSERWLRLMAPSGGWRALEHRSVLIEERPEPQRELAFRHGAWQEVLYEGLLKARRRELHEKAAAILSSEAGSRPDLAARAAWHWRCAERWNEALAWTLKAADHASALYSGAEAEATYRQCIALADKLDQPDAAAQAEAGLAELAEHQGEFAAALRHYDQAAMRLAAVPLLDPADPHFRTLRGRIQLGEARVHGRTGALTAARPLLEDLLESLKDAADEESRRLQVRALTEQAHVFRDLGLLQDAERSARRALKLADESGWNAEAAQAASALGRIYPLLGNWPAAEAVLRRAAHLAEAGGNWREAAGCWINLGSGLQSAGRLSEAAAALNHALEQSRRIGDAEKMAIIQMNLGTVQLCRGQWGEAEECFRAALEQFQAMEHGLGVAYCLYNLTETLRWAGRVSESTELLRAAERSLERVEAAQLRPHLMLSEAELLLAKGDGHGAARRAAEARVLAEELGYESGTNLARLTRGRALLHCGQLAEAERELESAADGFRQMDEPLEEARARAHLAEVLSRRGRTGKARSTSATALEIIRRLDAHPWLEHLPLDRD